MQKEKLVDFDIAQYLDSPEVITEYLKQVLDDGDAGEMAAALAHVARARSMTEIGEKLG